MITPKTTGSITNNDTTNKERESERERDLRIFVITFIVI